jgi:hypothetical protein
LGQYSAVVGARSVPSTAASAGSVMVTRGREPVSHRPSPQRSVLHSGRWGNCRCSGSSGLCRVWGLVLCRYSAQSGCLVLSLITPNSGELHAVVGRHCGTAALWSWAPLHTVWHREWGLVPAFREWTFRVMRWVRESRRRLLQPLRANRGVARWAVFEGWLSWYRSVGPSYRDSARSCGTRAGAARAQVIRPRDPRSVSLGRFGAVGCMLRVGSMVV